MEEIIQIIKQAQRKAIVIVRDLIMKSGLDPKDFDLAKKMRIGTMVKDEIAYYEAIDDEIIISKDFIGFIQRSIKNNTPQKAIDILAVTLAHETIHSCRVVISTEKVCTPFIAQVDLDELSNENIDLDVAYRVVACYENPEESRVDFVSSEAWKRQNILELIDKQESLEECLTEALAKIEEMSINSNQSIEEIAEKMIEDPNRKIVPKVGAKIIIVLQEDILNSFWNIGNGMNYMDILKERLGSDYLEFLNIVDSIYRGFIENSLRNPEEKWQQFNGLLERTRKIKK